MTYIFIGFGGLLGSLLRYFLSEVSFFYWDSSFPVGTLLTNLIGAFLLGLLSKFFSQKENINEKIKTAITTGAIGSFTTLSTLSTDTVQLLDHGSYFFALIYVTVSLAGGLIAVYIGGQYMIFGERGEVK